MIYTLTLNPSLDYHLRVKKLTPGGLHRCLDPYYVAGGKGICVSGVLSNLGVKNKALGFLGGFVGQKVLSLLENQHIHSDFIQIDHDTRLNVKVDGQLESELNAPGPTVTQDNWNKLCQQVSQIKSGDILVLSGSVCGGLPLNPYYELAKIAKQAGAQFVLDTTAQNIMAPLSLGPLFIKPNLSELEEMSGQILTDLQQCEEACRELINKGAGSVLCTMGGEGALFVTESECHFIKAPKGDVVSTIGSGDSTVAGMCAMWDRPALEKLMFAVACGSASAFTKGLASKKEIERVLRQIEKGLR